MRRLFFLCGLLAVFFVGCERETPESRFNIFIEGALRGERQQVEDSLKNFSINYLKHELSQVGKSGDWLEKLMSDTRDSKPVYQKTEWLVRNRLARVFFSHSGGRSDYLQMERHEGRWYIDLFPRQTTATQEELPEFVLSSQ